MIDWIRKNREFISILAINNYLRDKHGMPNSTIQKAVDESRNLPKKWEKPLSEFIKKLKE